MIGRVAGLRFLSVVRCTLRGMDESGGLAGLSDRDCVSGLEAACVTESGVLARKYRTVAEIDRRGLALSLGSSETKRWYARTARITETEAERHITWGYWLDIHTNVFDAAVKGDIHGDHIRAIVAGHDSVRTADPTLSDDELARVVATLLDHARDHTVFGVSRRAAELAHAAAEAARVRYEQERARRDADNPDPDDDDDVAPLGPVPVPLSENRAMNTLDLYPLPNGRMQLKGNLDILLAEKLQSVLSPLSKPEPSPDGTPDPRTASQRRADGLDRMLDLHIQGGKSPKQGGVRANVNLVVGLKDLLRPDRNTPTGGAGTGSGTGAGPGPGPGPGPGDPAWPFVLSWTGPISRRLTEMLSCDANLTPVIVDDAGVPLAMGRSERLAPPWLRAAVVVRDRCCIKCGKPAQWCIVHHVQYWVDGGTTDLNNSALVCGACHNEIHNTDWQLLIGEDGHPYCIPPAVVDPDRTPWPSFHRRRKQAA